MPLTDPAAEPSSPAETPARLPYIGRVTLAVAGIAFLVFSPALINDFVGLDDDWFIYKNPHLHPVTWESWWKLVGSAYHKTYAPLVHTTLAVEMLVWGDNPLGYHMDNLLLHAATVALLFRLLCTLVSDVRAAAVGALIFALHPMQVEPVVWATGRLSVLSGFLVVLAIHLYVAWVRRRSPIRYALTVIVFILAVLAKPTAVALPAFLFCIDYFALKRNLKAVLLPMVPLLALSLLFTLLTMRIQPTTDMGYISPWPVRPLVAGDALGFYVYKLLVPIRLAPDYGRTPQYVLGHGWVYLTALVPVILVLLIWMRTGRSTWLAAAGLFVAGTAPTLGLFPFMFQRYSTVSDAHFYLGMTGLALAVAWLLIRYRARPVLVACSVLLCAFAVGSVLQTRHWRDTAALCKYALEVNPNSALMHATAGNFWMTKRKPDQAIAHFRRLVELRPELPDAHNNLGTALLRANSTNEAIRTYERAVGLDPDHATARANLGHALLRKGDLKHAREVYQAALELDPARPKVLANLAAIHVKTAKPQRAIELYRKVLQIAPGDYRLHKSLAFVLRQVGKIDEAIQHYQTALKLAPERNDVRFTLADIHLGRKEIDQAILQYSNIIQRQPEDETARSQLGILLAAKGDLPRAVHHLTEAVRINPYNAKARRSLGQIYAKQGKIDEAIGHLSESLRLKPDDPELHTVVGNLLVGAKKLGQAAAHYRQALEMKPGSPEPINHLAWILATSPDDTLRNADEAVSLAERAARLTGNKNASVLDTLAAAYAEAGRFGEAISTARRARELADIEKQTKLRKQIELRIKRYEMNEPFREN